ncbi:enoyl-CoA hydratase-related protein [Hydrogenophaga sp.]|uniref:enoyl-CoA hydratase-related protein n=1 Tax=Hydrogenophaga sp. TaxID=1904254 RepID=UPI00271948F0|nr:enoyl-CoA hydratase-related protein [Hydrogenophaga sp.]MDO9433914.1 enoyl-CoA hydratase-related protein [Hydrogenophaga sp.]
MKNMNGIEWNVDALGVGRIVLNRPEHNNALGPENAPALVQAIGEVLGDSPRVVTIEARGPIFCAGGDIREFVKAGDRLDELVDEILDQLLPAYLQLAQATCPIVTVVGGPVGGAGVGLALCGDFVLASDTMKLRTGYAAIGLSPDVGASYFLARRVGPVRAQQWLMLSDAVDAQRCLAAGAVDQVHPAAELNAAAQALVERLCASAPASLAAMKQLSLEGPALSLQAYLSLEQQLLKACARTADAREGTSAFVAKRKPVFSGR